MPDQHSRVCTTRSCVKAAIQQGLLLVSHADKYLRHAELSNLGGLVYGFVCPQYSTTQSGGAQTFGPPHRSASRSGSASALTARGEPLQVFVGSEESPVRYKVQLCNPGIPNSTNTNAGCGRNRASKSEQRGAGRPWNTLFLWCMDRPRKTEEGLALGGSSEKAALRSMEIHQREFASWPSSTESEPLRG